jgi:hypothetical protein
MSYITCKIYINFHRDNVYLLKIIMVRPYFSLNVARGGMVLSGLVVQQARFLPSPAVSKLLKRREPPLSPPPLTTEGERRSHESFLCHPNQ